MNVTGKNVKFCFVSIFFLHYYVQIQASTLTTFECTVKPVLSGHRIKRTPSIKRTVAEGPKIYFPYLL